MNKWIGIGRLTDNPDVRYSTGKDGQLAIARYRLAVDRKGKDAGADFIPCVVFGKGAEFAEKYLSKGMKIAVSGRIQTGSYEKDGRKVYTTEVIVEDQEFCEKKGETEEPKYEPKSEPKSAPADQFMVIDEGDFALPFGEKSK